MSHVPNGFEPTLPGNLPRDRRHISPINGKKDSFLSSNRPSLETQRGAWDPNYDIVVHSHLCWDWVWQRPQQFVSRLSRRHKVLFVETISPDPNLVAPFAQFRTADGLPDITVLRIQFPAWRWADGDFVDRERRRLVQEFIAGPAEGRFRRPVQWFYDPMAATAFAGHLNECLTVYDCMDELSQFRCAPPDIRQRETRLLGHADVVFTGGRRLYESKRAFNSNCHFYGCGVDVAHFGRALEAGTRVPDDLLCRAKPVLGYFGVVDERLDYELIARLADAFPDGTVAIVGPVLKVDPASLPQRANLLWLGQRPYEVLPEYCKAFDVCLMPFALNEATEFINPTKALEYMASGRQVVSTAVPDVVRNFGTVVKVAGNAEEFVELCRDCATQPDAAAIERGLKMAESQTWDSIVAELEHHVEQALVRRASEVVA